MRENKVAQLCHQVCAEFESTALPPRLVSSSSGYLRTPSWEHEGMVVEETASHSWGHQPKVLASITGSLLTHWRKWPGDQL